MTLQIFITIFFRLINFGIFIGLMIYVYKKYMYELLLDGINQEQKSLLTLEHEAHDIRQKRIALDAQLLDDQDLIVVLKKKIALWAIAERERRQKRNEYKDAQSKKLQERACFKQVRIAEFMIEKDSMPLIIAQARKDLIEYYKNDKESHNYIECIIDTFNQESSMHECR